MGDYFDKQPDELAVHEYDELATPSQPILRELKAIRDNMRGEV